MSEETKDTTKPASRKAAAKHRVKKVEAPVEVVEENKSDRNTRLHPDKPNSPNNPLVRQIVRRAE